MVGNTCYLGISMITNTTNIYIHTNVSIAYSSYIVNKPLSSLLISVVSSSESGRAGGR